MLKSRIFKDYNHVHFIGIGGISMQALARYCIANGLNVSGSDCTLGDCAKSLITLGVPVLIGHKEKNVSGADLIVYTSAIQNDNPELVYAKRLGVSIMKRSEFLGEILKDFSKTIAVCGSHGKTTTTSMIAHIFTCANVNPTAFIGGEDSYFGNLLQGEKQLAICEACEYKKNFLNIYPNVAVVLNVDKDHCDSYADMQEQILAFKTFIKNSVSIVNVDDQNSSQIINDNSITFGIEKKAIYTARNLRSESGRYNFDFYYKESFIGEICLNVSGKHNVYNALASATCGHFYGLNFEIIKKGLQTFQGVKRRNEYLGKLLRKNVYCDYAHHPKEITATLKTFQEQKDNPLVIFQPHTYSRTIALMDDFTKSLSKCQSLIVYKTYGAREKYNKEGSAYNLYLNVKNQSDSPKTLLYADNPSQLYSYINGNLDNASCILTLGAGNVYDIVKNFVQKDKKI